MAITLDPRYVVELQPVRRAPSVRRTPSLGAARVYRRRRVVATTVLALGLLGVVHGGRAVLADPAGPSGAAIVPAAAQASQYVVQPGDTMWSIAERFAGAVSVGSYVDALIHVNGGASIQAGQSLTLP